MNKVKTFFETLSLLTGGKKHLAAFFAGALTTLALPPFGLFPVLVLTVSSFIALCASATSRKQAFLSGWAFGGGFFIFGLYWISAALFVDIKSWGWVLPLSAVVGPGIYALYYGFIPLLIHALRRDIVSYSLAFVAMWSCVEWLRGHLFTGFPWNLIGYTWNHALPIMQASALIGVYGLTLLTLLWSCLPLFFTQKSGKAISFMLILSFIASFSLGAARLHTNPTQQNEKYSARIVQPNLSQSQKWDQEEAKANVAHHLKLTESEKKDTFTFFIWPETSIRAPIQTYPEIKSFLSSDNFKNTYGILGALHIRGENNDDLKFYNGVSVINSRGSVIATYDKHHLVPFGEYIPFRKIFNATPIGASIAGLGDFSPGIGAATIRISGLPSFSPLICYEAIFPSEVIAKSDRPDWLVNVTNDGWYGKTAGPYQHLEITRVRAIEEGLPLARAANTGISAMIDPLGRIIASKPLGETGVVDSILPAPLSATLYSKVGDLLFLAMAALCFALCFILKSKK